MYMYFERQKTLRESQAIAYGGGYYITRIVLNPAWTEYQVNDQDMKQG